MKTTIDLPPDRVREMKLLAAREGRKLKDVAADLLKRGLISGKNAATSAPHEDFFLTAPANAPEMTPERVRQILVETP